MPRTRSLYRTRSTGSDDHRLPPPASELAPSSLVLIMAMLAPGAPLQLPPAPPPNMGCESSPGCEILLLGEATREGALENGSNGKLLALAPCKVQEVLSLPNGIGISAGSADAERGSNTGAGEPAGNRCGGSGDSDGAGLARPGVEQGLVATQPAEGIAPSEAMRDRVRAIQGDASGRSS
jgi:hypothetical protein